jgi:hypothetical protein
LHGLDPCPAVCQDYFELGVILTRKKLYTQATKNLEKARKVWEGDESELAQACAELCYADSLPAMYCHHCTALTCNVADNTSAHA